MIRISSDRFNIALMQSSDIDMPPFSSSWRSIKAKDGEKMYWTMSDLLDWLLCPVIPGAKAGHIHLHRNRDVNDVQVWLLGLKDGDWVDISEEYKTCGTDDGQAIVRHPLYADLVLKRRHDSNAPSFVKEKARKIGALMKSTQIQEQATRKSSRKGKDRAY